MQGETTNSVELFIRNANRPKGVFISVSTHIDIRVLAATNRDIETAVKTGDFRADLYYRIAAFPIVVSPLRERRADIPPLANHFLSKYAESSEKNIESISVNALSVLMQYRFPGNVRELESERG